MGADTFFVMVVLLVIVGVVVKFVILPSKRTILKPCQKCGGKVLSITELLEHHRKAGFVVDFENETIKPPSDGINIFEGDDAINRAANGMFSKNWCRNTYQSLSNNLKNYQGFKCKSCSSIYCSKCLNSAQEHQFGGKACPNCGGRFNYLKEYTNEKIDMTNMIKETIGKKGALYPKEIKGSHLFSSIRNSKVNETGNIFNAAAGGRIDALQALISSGIDVNQRKEDGWTALMSAVLNCQFDAAKILIDAGADPNIKNALGETALTKVGNNLDLAKLLVDAGAFIDAKSNFDGQTPLMIAAKGGHIEIVKLIVSRGADINASDMIGCTPLLLASSHGKTDVVEFLINCDAAIDPVNAYGMTALKWAEEKGFLEIKQLLLNKEIDS